MKAYLKRSGCGWSLFLQWILWGIKNWKHFGTCPQTCQTNRQGMKKGQRQLLWKTRRFFRLLRARQRDNEIQRALGLFHSEAQYPQFCHYGYCLVEMPAKKWLRMAVTFRRTKIMIWINVFHVTPVVSLFYGSPSMGFAHGFLPMISYSIASPQPGSSRVHCLGKQCGPGWLADANMSCTSQKNSRIFVAGKVLSHEQLVTSKAAATVMTQFLVTKHEYIFVIETCKVLSVI